MIKIFILRNDPSSHEAKPVHVEEVPLKVDDNEYTGLRGVKVSGTDSVILLPEHEVFRDLLQVGASVTIRVVKETHSTSGMFSRSSRGPVKISGEVVSNPCKDKYGSIRQAVKAEDGETYLVRVNEIVRTT